MYFIVKSSIFLDIYTSINDDKINSNAINKEKKVCLNIFNLIFSLLISSIIELCNLIPLTPSARIQGIKIIVCRKSADKKNNIPFPQSKSKYYRRNCIS